MMISKTSNYQPRIVQVLYRWALVTLGKTLFYNIKEMSSLQWCINISIIIYRSLCPPSSSTDTYNFKNNKLEELGMVGFKTINVYLKKVKYPVTHQNVSRYYPNGYWCSFGRLLSIAPNMWKVFCDVYISKLFENYLCHPPSSNGKSNANNN